MAEEEIRCAVCNSTWIADVFCEPSSARCPWCQVRVLKEAMKRERDRNRSLCDLNKALEEKLVEHRMRIRTAEEKP